MNEAERLKGKEEIIEIVKSVDLTDGDENWIAVLSSNGVMYMSHSSQFPQVLYNMSRLVRHLIMSGDEDQDPLLSAQMRQAVVEGAKDAEEMYLAKAATKH